VIEDNPVPQERVKGAAFTIEERRAFGLIGRSRLILSKNSALV